VLFVPFVVELFPAKYGRAGKPNSVNHRFAEPHWQIQDISHGFANPPERFVVALLAKV
jgi:hypothetical protein